MIVDMKKIAIIGSGAMGVALAINFAKNENLEKIFIYSRNQEAINAINHSHKFLFDGVTLSEKIFSSSDLNEIYDYEIIFIAVNSVGFADIIEKISTITFVKHPIIVLCTKSIGSDGEFLNTIAENRLKNKNIALLYGPSFAHEIANGEITCVNFICQDTDIFDKAKLLVDKKTNLKLFYCSDLIGAQICSIMKNICAIYIGVMKGYGAKNDTIAIIFKLFVEEMVNTITIHGGDKKTIFEFCGIGDLFLTCTSVESRNYSFGYDIGVTKNIKLMLEKYNGRYPEGYNSLENLLKLNKKRNFYSPLCEKLLGFFDAKVDIGSLKAFF